MTKDKSKIQWTVTFSNRASKERKKMPPKIQVLVDLIALEIEKVGPQRTNWQNYGPLKKTGNIPERAFHCHLKRGKPTYVSCWWTVDKKNKHVEIFYVGTHEKAPY